MDPYDEPYVRTGGRLLLRACRSAAGISNDIDEPLLRRLFCEWRMDGLDEAEIMSDTRRMRALVVRLSRPGRPAGPGQTPSATGEV